RLGEKKKYAFLKAAGTILIPDILLSYFHTFILSVSLNPQKSPGYLNNTKSNREVVIVYGSYCFPPEV
ncbi:hypothetical protein OA40_11685, partial [Morganella morganii]|uniref:hypothetical protein n=1 Tax=Morganella morganii TaxID=582 RepID=UPI00062C632F